MMLQIWWHVDMKYITFAHLKVMCIINTKDAKTSWGWAVPSSVEVEVWGLIKALSLIFKNNNVEEVWSQRSLKLKKLLDEKVWSWGSFRWWSLNLKKF